MKHASVKKLIITRENAEYQIIHSLKTNREKRNKLHEVFVEGIECIKQAVHSKIKITRIITADYEALSDWARELISSNNDAKIIEMAGPLYQSLCDKSNPSELLATVELSPWEIHDINTENPFIIVFDRPSDYGNLGTLIRSANAFCADGIFLVGHGIDMYESKVIRASLGSIFSTKIVQIQSLDILKNFIEAEKQKNNMTVIGTDSAGDTSIRNEKIKRPVMVIIGNEAMGMSVKLKDLCDKIISIPMGGIVNSLNVSCAASIIMWEITRMGSFLSMRAEGEILELINEMCALFHTLALPVADNNGFIYNQKEEDGMMIYLGGFKHGRI